jgi:hypothetical protein
MRLDGQPLKVGLVEHAVRNYQCQRCAVGQAIAQWSVVGCLLTAAERRRDRSPRTGGISITGNDPALPVNDNSASVHYGKDGKSRGSQIEERCALAGPLHEAFSEIGTAVHEGSCATGTERSSLSGYTVVWRPLESKTAAAGTTATWPQFPEVAPERSNPAATPDAASRP